MGIFDFRFSIFDSGRGEGGYTLVIVVLTVAIMSIMMAVAVQTVEFQMRREREAELIFRGEQYVEAIRLFKIKYGRNPMQLKELWEANPKVMRQKWKDPMTDSEEWGLIFLGQEGRRIGPESAFPGTPVPTETVTHQGTKSLTGDQPFGGPGQGGEKIGPIVGVRSTVCEDSIKIYEGRSNYCEWQFVHRERGRGLGTTKPLVPPGQQPPGNQQTKVSGSGSEGGGPGSGGPGGSGGNPPPGYTPTIYR